MSSKLRSNRWAVVHKLNHTISLQILDYYKKADNLAKRSYEIFMSKNWVLEKTTDCGDEVYSMVLPKPDGKIFKITVWRQTMKLIFFNLSFELNFHSKLYWFTGHSRRFSDTTSWLSIRRCQRSCKVEQKNLWV